MSIVKASTHVPRKYFRHVAHNHEFLWDMQACSHQFFDELREPGCQLPSGRPIPPLFNFTVQELKGATPELLEKLIPTHARKEGEYEALLQACSRE